MDRLVKRKDFLAAAGGLPGHSRAPLPPAPLPAGDRAARTGPTGSQKHSKAAGGSRVFGGRVVRGGRLPRGSSRRYATPSIKPERSRGGGGRQQEISASCRGHRALPIAFVPASVALV